MLQPSLADTICHSGLKPVSYWLACRGVLLVFPGYLWLAVGQLGGSASRAWLAVSWDDEGDEHVSLVL